MLDGAVGVVVHAGTDVGHGVSVSGYQQMLLGWKSTKGAHSRVGTMWHHTGRTGAGCIYIVPTVSAVSLTRTTERGNSPGEGFERTLDSIGFDDLDVRNFALRSNRGAVDREVRARGGLSTGLAGVVEVIAAIYGILAGGKSLRFSTPKRRRENVQGGNIPSVVANRAGSLVSRRARLRQALGLTSLHGNSIR